MGGGESSGHRETYTHAEGATKIVQDDPRTRVASVIHDGRAVDEFV